MQYGKLYIVDTITYGYEYNSYMEYLEELENWNLDKPLPFSCIEKSIINHSSYIIPIKPIEHPQATNLVMFLYNKQILVSYISRLDITPL